jgi:hypothetical protein
MYDRFQDVAQYGPILEKPYDEHIGVLYPFILGLCL